MEVAGLAVGIVPLYNAIIDILGRVDAYRKFGAESQTSFVHFEAAKVRLQDWADSVGIRDGRLADHHDSRLDEHKRAWIIKMALEALKTLLDEVEHTSLSMKLPTRRPTAEAGFWPTHLDRNTDKPEHHQVLSKRSRLNWAMGGKEKFNRNIAVLEGLVAVLYQVAPPGNGDAGQWLTSMSYSFDWWGGQPIPRLPAESDALPANAILSLIRLLSTPLILSSNPLGRQRGTFHRLRGRLKDHSGEPHRTRPERYSRLARRSQIRR